MLKKFGKLGIGRRRPAASPEGRTASSRENTGATSATSRPEISRGVKGEVRVKSVQEFLNKIIDLSKEMVDSEQSTTYKELGDMIGSFSTEKGYKAKDIIDEFPEDLYDDTAVPKGTLIWIHDSAVEKKDALVDRTLRDLNRNTLGQRTSEFKETRFYDLITKFNEALAKDKHDGASGAAGASGAGGASAADRRAAYRRSCETGQSTVFDSSSGEEEESAGGIRRMPQPLNEVAWTWDSRA